MLPLRNSSVLSFAGGGYENLKPSFPVALIPFRLFIEITSVGTEKVVQDCERKMIVLS